MAGSSDRRSNGGDSIKSFGSNKNVVHRPQVSLRNLHVEQPSNKSQQLDTLALCRTGIPQRKVGSEPAGFVNPGVLCYRNSVISLLLNCEPLLGWLVNVHEPACGNIYQSCLACALANIAPLYWEHDTQPKCQELEVRIQNFWAQAKLDHGPIKNPTKWPTGDSLAEIQEDADEFLTWLLQVWRTDSTTYLYVPAHLVEYQAQLTCNRDNEADLDALFRFGVEARIKCGNDQCRAERLGVMDDQTLVKLPLPKLAKTDKTTLEALLAEHFDPQTREYKCQHCQKKSDATVYSTLREAPEILIIVLKRFEYNKTMRGARKIVSIVQLPETLDLTPFLAQSAIGAGENAVYTLKSVSSHAGALRSGHYEAWLNGPADAWFRVIDSKVTNISFDKVNANRYGTKNKPMTPYILAYVRQPPSSSPKTPSSDTHSPSPGRHSPSPGRVSPSPGRVSPSPGRVSPSPSIPSPSPDKPLPSTGKPLLSTSTKSTPPTKKRKYEHDPDVTEDTEKSSPHKTELKIRLSLLDDIGSPMAPFASLSSFIETSLLGDNPPTIGLQLFLETSDKRYKEEPVVFLERVSNSAATSPKNFKTSGTSSVRSINR